jgi:hypothetical protein
MVLDETTQAVHPLRQFSRRPWRRCPARRNQDSAAIEPDEPQSRGGVYRGHPVSVGRHRLGFAKHGRVAKALARDREGPHRPCEVLACWVALHDAATVSADVLIEAHEEVDVIDPDSAMPPLEFGRILGRLTGVRAARLNPLRYRLRGSPRCIRPFTYRSHQCQVSVPGRHFGSGRWTI